MKQVVHYFPKSGTFLLMFCAHRPETESKASDDRVKSPNPASSF